MPSGNDAAHALAEFFGEHLKKEAMEREKEERARQEKEDLEKEKEMARLREKMKNMNTEEETNADILSSSPSNQFLQT